MTRRTGRCSLLIILPLRRLWFSVTNIYTMYNVAVWIKVKLFYHSRNNNYKINIIRSERERWRYYEWNETDYDRLFCMFKRACHCVFCLCFSKKCSRKTGLLKIGLIDKPPIMTFVEDNFLMEALLLDFYISPKIQHVINGTDNRI